MVFAQVSEATALSNLHARADLRSPNGAADECISAKLTMAPETSLRLLVSAPAFEDQRHLTGDEGTAVVRQEVAQRNGLTVPPPRSESRSTKPSLAARAACGPMRNPLGSLLR